MICPNCGQEIEKGKFCTNCGAQLPEDESAAASESSPQIPPQQQNPASNQSSQGAQNESVEKLKNAGANFGHFVVTLVKRPSEAKNANSNDLISSITAIVIYALLLALGIYLVFRAAIGNVGDLGGFMDGPEVTFFDSFLLPLIEFLILLLIVAGLTFAATKLSAQTLSFADVVGKYGAYLMPYLLLYVVGFLLGFAGIPSLASLFILLSMLGALMIAPTFILLEQPAGGFDRIYLLLALYFVAFIVCSFFLQSFAKTLIESMLGGVMGGFGGF